MTETFGFLLSDTSRLLRRRFDERSPGFGFGLSITSELAELYAGSLTLDRSEELGGLRVALRLPASA